MSQFIDHDDSDDDDFNDEEDANANATQIGQRLADIRNNFNPENIRKSSKAKATFKKHQSNHERFIVYLFEKRPDLLHPEFRDSLQDTVTEIDYSDVQQRYCRYQRNGGKKSLEQRKADYRIGNLEVPVATGGQAHASKIATFRALHESGCFVIANAWDAGSAKLLASLGFEALARWRSPQLGLISPDIFVPIAEEIGLINELSERLMEQAFADAREWDDSLTLSINISPVQLRDPWFAQRLLKKLVAAGFPPQRLEIEITESCLHENIGLVRSMIMSLRNQGVQISLDDFGTGYSSLEQLRNLPFDRIKIDRSFISELREPGNHSRIVEAIISLGRGLDLPLTAEGVEDEQILKALKSMGRLKAQGYFYGQPEDAEAVRVRLKAAGRLNGSTSEPVGKPPRNGTDDGPTLYRIARP